MVRAAGDEKWRIAFLTNWRPPNRRVITPAAIEPMPIKNPDVAEKKVKKARRL